MVEQRASSSVLLVVYQLAQIHDFMSHLGGSLVQGNSESKLVRLVNALFCEYQMLTFSLRQGRWRVRRSFVSPTQGMG